MTDFTEIEKILVTVGSSAIVLNILGALAFFFKKDNKSTMSRLDDYALRITASESNTKLIASNVSVLRKDVDTLQVILSEIIKQGHKLELSNVELSVNQKNNIIEVKKVGEALEGTQICLTSILKENQAQNELMKKFFETRSH